MNIAIIGSTAYEPMMRAHQKALINEDHEVRVPALDNFAGLNELAICEYNRDMIEWADEVHLIWDGRSTGTLIDFGMTFALRKKLEIIFINPKTILNFITQYADTFQGKVG